MIFNPTNFFVITVKAANARKADLPFFALHLLIEASNQLPLCFTIAKYGISLYDKFFFRNLL